MKEKLNGLYQQYGYRKFKLTKFEPYDLYADNRDFLNTNQLITFTDLDGSLLALKPDVTLSIVKSNAGGAEKVYYNETVYRPKDNHYREILQSGVECLGSIDVYAEAEVIALAAKSMALISDNFVIRVSDAAFLNQMFDSMELSAGTVKEVLGLLSMKNSAGLDRLVERGVMTKASAANLKGIIDMYLPFREGVETITRLAFSNAAARTAEHLGELADVLQSFGVLPHIYLDFSLVNSLDYYQGIMFQGAAEEIPFTVLNGGRYDRLPEKMGKRIGAIGFALYLDTVENYRKQKKEFDVDYLITYEDDDDFCQLAAVVERMTACGVRVRSVRKDEESRLDHKITAKEVLTFREALGKELRI